MFDELTWSQIEMLKKRIEWKKQNYETVAEKAGTDWNTRDSVVLHNKAIIYWLFLKEIDDFCEEMQDIQMEKTLKNNY